MRPTTEDSIARVRAICLDLPQVTEDGGVASGVGALSGTRVVGFKIGRRIVARLFVLDPDGRESVVLWMRADPQEREALVRSGHPYFRAGPRELGIVLDAATDWTEIAELVTESYVIMAPRKLAATVEDEHTDAPWTTPPRPQQGRRRGLGAELGVYDDVFLCLSPGEPWLEHGIVEHRYKERCPTAYREMIERWGHVSQGPRRYTVTAFLTRAWSQLAAEGLLASQLGPATGLYRHNGRILYWALPPGTDARRIRTWADFAADLAISAEDWTLPT